MTGTDPRAASDRYVSGPAAATEATVRALPAAEAAHTVVLVEGVSDQIAIETLARATGRSLDGVAVLPTGGAHGMARHAARLAVGRRLVGLCDVGEEAVVRRALAAAGLEVELLVCDRDLEDELIRAVTPERAVDLVDAAGDGRALRTLQRQGSWAGRPVHDQLRRFLGSGATRKSRYAESLVALAVQLDTVPPVLRAVLAALDGRGSSSPATPASG